MSAAPYIIIILIMVIVLIIYGVWIYSTSKSKTGFFAPYKPNVGKDLTLIFPESDDVPLTDDQIKLKNELVNKALEKASRKE